MKKRSLKRRRKQRLRRPKCKEKANGRGWCSEKAKAVASPRAMPRPRARASQRRANRKEEETLARMEGRREKATATGNSDELRRASVR